MAHIITKKDSDICGIALLLLLFVPNVGVLAAINIIIAVFLAYRYRTNYKARWAAMIMCAVMLVSFLLSDFSLFNSKSLLRAVSIALYLFLFPFVEDIKISNKYYYIGIIAIFASQLAYVFNIQPAIQFMIEYLPTNEDPTEYVERYQSAGYGTFSIRFGGVYGNANLAAKYVSFLFLSFLLDNKELKLKKILPLLTIASLSILLTGSRTGMFVLLFSVFFYTFKMAGKKYIIYPIILIAVLAFVNFARTSLSTEYRGFALQEGLNDSMGEKSDLFFHTMSEASAKDLLFGTFWVKEKGAVMDSEWGDSIFTYGWIYIFAYALFVFAYFKCLRKDSRMVMLIFLWAISSTFLMSFRTSVIALFILSKFCGGRHRTKKTEIITNINSIK